MSDFNPSEHKVDEVDAYLNEADEAERERVLAAEAEGQNRKALQDWQPAEQDAADAEAAEDDKGDEPETGAVAKNAVKLALGKSAKAGGRAGTGTPFTGERRDVGKHILNAFEGKPLPVYGAGLNVRDWLHVEDHCAAIWTIMTQAAPGETYAVGGRCELTNIDVVKRICAAVDRLAPALSSGKPRESLITYVKDRPGHDHRYAIDCSRLERDLGWRQTETAESGFEKTVRWYLDNAAWVESVRTGAYRQWLEKNYAARG